MKILSFLFGSSAKAQPARPSKSAADVGRGLRQMMLTTPPERTGQQPTTDFPAAMAFVRAADRLFDASTPTTTYPYPSDDRVRFYLLTFGGVRVVETDLASLEKGTGAYAEYFNLGQAVLTQLRLVAEERQ